MNRNELENIIGKKLGAAGEDQRTAMDVFIQNVSENINIGDTIRIPDIGMFQLKKIEKSQPTASLNDSSKSIYRLFYVPLTNKKGLSEVIVFNVIPDLKKKDVTVDDAFSISIGKPLIPLSEIGRDEFLVESSFIMHRGNYREKAQELLENAIYLKDFKLDIPPKLFQDDIIQATLQEAEEKYHKEVDLEFSTIPWDFGIPSGPESPDEKAEGQKIELREDDFHSELIKSNKETDEINGVKSFEDQQIINSIQEPANNYEINTRPEERISDIKNENDTSEINVQNTLETQSEIMADSQASLLPNETNIESESNLNNIMNNIGNSIQEEKKSNRWLWLIIFLIILIAVGLFYYFLIFKNSGKYKPDNQNSQLNYSNSCIIQDYFSWEDSFFSCGNFQKSNVVNFIRLEI